MSIFNQQEAKDPSSALQKLFNIPLQHDISSNIEKRIAALVEKSSIAAEDISWQDLYREAIATIKELISEISEQEDIHQQQMLDLDRSVQNQKEEIQKLKKTFDQKLRNISTEITRLSRSWKERSKRQLEQIIEECSQSATQTVQFQEVEIKNGLMIEICPKWWQQFNDHVINCCEVWSQDFSAKSMKEIDQNVQKHINEIGAIVDLHSSPSAPDYEAPQNQCQLPNEELPKQKLNIPSKATALMQYLRTHIMTVGIFSTLLGGLIVAAQMFLGSGSGKANTMVIRGVLMAAVLPILLVLGWIAVKKQQAIAHEDAQEKQKEASLKQIRRHLKIAIERHRGSMVRWLDDVSQKWENQIEEWRKAELIPIVRNKQSQMEKQAGDNKRQRNKLSEKEYSLKSFRKSSRDTLLFELKKDLRRHQ